MLTIHHLQRGQSERIIWLCEELSIPYSLTLHHRDPFLSPPALLSLTPLGAAPVLIDPTFPPSGSTPLILSESPAIAEYIIHKHGSGRLALAPSHKNYPDYLYWFHLANGNLQPNLLTAFRFSRSGAAPDDPARKNTEARLERLLKVHDERLSSVPWLAGEEFSAADIMTVFSLTTMRLFYPLDLTPYGGILDWLQRVGRRPAYRAAMEKGDPGFTPVLGAEVPPPFTGN